MRRWETLLFGLMVLGIYNLLCSYPNVFMTRRMQTAHPLIPTKYLPDVFLLEALFLPPDGLSKFDIYGGAWWQSVDRFMEPDYNRMYTLEDGTFLPIYSAGNGSMDVRMTVDWLVFAVEHLSDFNRLLDVNASDHLILKLEQYIAQTTITSTAMKSTLAVLPFQACDKDERVALRVTGNFCQTALAATVASLVRQSVHRVVVVTSHEDLSMVQEAIEDLAKQFSSIAQIVAMPTNPIRRGAWTLLPKTALVLLHEAWSLQNTTWLGSNPHDIKYIYFTEPDQILNGKLSADMQSIMDRNRILVPHRLEVIPHADDFLTVVETSSVKIPSLDHPVHVSPLVCCNGGRKRIQRCPGELAWYKCTFPPFNNSFEKVFDRRDQHLMRISQGSGFTVLTMQGIGLDNSFCNPQQTALSCTDQQGTAVTSL